MIIENRESQIENIFATHPNEFINVLSINDHISLISRQIFLPAGNKINLLFLSSTTMGVEMSGDCK